MEKSIEAIKAEYHIPEQNSLRPSGTKWDVRGSYDTDIDTFEEIDENGNIVNIYTVKTTTKTYPPFNVEKPIVEKHKPF